MHRRMIRCLLPALLLAAGLWAAIPAGMAQEAAVGPVARKLEIATYRNIPYQADFLSSGGAVSYQVETQPRRGSVTVEGSRFTYTPEEGRTGTDTFTYTACDAEGNRSAPTQVRIRIRNTKSGVCYADLDGEACAAAAQTLAEKGIFAGSRLGQSWFFEPEQTVSRSEFLAMTMEAAGLAPEQATMTGFCDDAAIPAWAKSYAAAGAADGVIRGSATDAGIAFRPSDPICRDEAAVILNRVLALSDVDLTAWYADREAVPSWAAQAVGNLESVSVLAAGSYGDAALARPVTRADAAQMLTAAMALLDGRQSGALAWLRTMG